MFAVVPRAELTRTLRMRGLTFIVVGTVIGSGIFTVPGAVLRDTGGDVGFALLAWVLGGGVSLLGALTYGELGAMLPEAGGAYVYVREAFGRLPAFLLGWTLFFVISTGSVATLAVAFAEYLRQFVPLGGVGSRLPAAVAFAPAGGGGGPGGGGSPPAAGRGAAGGSGGPIPLGRCRRPARRPPRGARGG